MQIPMHIFPIGLAFINNIWKHMDQNYSFQDFKIEADV